MNETGQSDAGSERSAVAASLETRRGGCDRIPRRPEPRLVPASAIVATADVAPHGATGGGDASAAERAADTAPGPRPFRFLPLACTGIAFAASFLAYCAAAPFLAKALALHGWRMWGSLAMGVIPVAGFLGFPCFVLWRLRRLPNVEQVSQEDFDSPAALRAKLAESYLSSLPDAESYAAENGFRDTDGKQRKTPLVRCIRRLQGEIPGRYADSNGWLDDFRAFQEMQDERAGEIIARHAAWVGLKTAAAPWKIVDMAVVVHHSTEMIAALAQLYNRKIPASGAVRLGLHWLAAVYLSGELGDAAQEAAGWASDLASAAVKPLAAVVGKAAEGGANALLVLRLGACAKKAFRPLK